MVDDAKFSLYMPEWRVPEPPPATIAVLLVPGELPPAHGLTLSSDDAQSAPEFRQKPVVAAVSKTREHTKTMRYDPLGHPDSWEIGSPYIPFQLTFDCADIITLIVFWSVDQARIVRNQLGLSSCLAPFSI
jgi:hypothetical protein